MAYVDAKETGTKIHNYQLQPWRGMVGLAKYVSFFFCSTLGVFQ